MADLRASETSYTAVQEVKNSLLETNKSYERTVESMKSQLHEEITARKLAEQKLDGVTAQLRDIEGQQVGIHNIHLLVQM